jgi:mannose-6-phosphate isomerase-like protein (cupin superfamily)
MIKKKSSQAVEARKNMRAGSGEITIRHYLNKEEIKAKCRLCAQLIIPPGSSIGLHEHTQEDEVFIIQEGKGITLDEGRETEVEKGDTIITGAGASHAIRNTGATDLVITAIIMQY